METIIFSSGLPFSVHLRKNHYVMDLPNSINERRLNEKSFPFFYVFETMRVEGRTGIIMDVIKHIHAYLYAIEPKFEAFLSLKLKYTTLLQKLFDATVFTVTFHPFSLLKVTL